VGDAVFKVSSDQAFTMSEAACRRKLEKSAARPSPVSLAVAMPDNATLSIRGETGDITVTRDYPVETFPATDRPLSSDTLKGVFEKTAGEPFVLEQLEAGKLPPLVIPPSRLKEIRRDFYGVLRQAVNDRAGSRRSENLKGALSDLLPPAKDSGETSKIVTVAIRDIRDVHILNDPLVDRVLLPFTAGNVQGLGRSGKRLSGREDRLIWDLPFILFDSEWSEHREAVKSLVNRGHRNFRLNNLGHFNLFDGIEGVELSTGYRLFSLNSQALLAWKELGAKEATLYVEDDRDNLRHILQRNSGLRLALTVYGSVPLITSRIPIRGVRQETPLLSDRNDAYRVSQRGGLTVVTSEVDFSLLGRLGEIQAMGCGSLVLDLNHLGPFSAAGKKVLDALRKGSEVPGTSVFNFEMGME
jgi:putative protease